MGKKFLLSASDEAIDLLLREDLKFWKSGSGTAELRYFCCENTYHSLVVMSRPGVGFHVTFAKFAQEIHVPGSTFTAVNDAEYNQKTSLWVGGDYFLFPTACFLDESTFRKIVSDFLRTGEKCKRIIWEENPLSLDDDNIYGEPY